MKEVMYNIHHQAVCDCPECGEMHITDLGEMPEGDGVKIKCRCGCEFELGNDN
ncbi:MAG: hypothetical protein KAS32_04540 [Candidatus Peribacteraceae bacterium]|nr:hypothetical protein [Candidatus Peribacteraceae bacterium]